MVMYGVGQCMVMYGVGHCIRSVVSVQVGQCMG